MARLVLFDIDETMISSDGAGRRAIGKALSEMFRVDPSRVSVSMSGKTDPQILTEILRAADMSDKEISARMDEMFDIYLSLLQAEIDASSSYIIHEGVRDILDQLESRDDTYLGLLTGNIEPGARMKLSTFNLNDYFPIGAYGSDSADRMDLPDIATRRGAEHYKVQFRPAEVVIIGDSIFDVRCAKGYGARSIAVNTGVTTREQLELEDPDHLFDSLANTRSVLEAIVS